MKEKTDISISIGKALHKLRKEAGLTQMQFCMKSGIDLKYLSNIENGRRNPSLEVIERIAGTLGIKISEFFKMMEEMDC